MKRIRNQLIVFLIASVISIITVISTLSVQTTSNVKCTNVPCAAQENYEYYVQWGWPIPFIVDANSINDGHNLLKLDIPGDDFQVLNFIGTIAIYMIAINGLILIKDKIRKK